MVNLEPKRTKEETLKLKKYYYEQRVNLRSFQQRDCTMKKIRENHLI